MMAVTSESIYIRVDGYDEGCEHSHLHRDIA